MTDSRAASEALPSLTIWNEKFQIIILFYNNVSIFPRNFLNVLEFVSVSKMVKVKNSQGDENIAASMVMSQTHNFAIPVSFKKYVHTTILSANQMVI